VKCPGQNRQYWKPEDIFETNCSQCGNPVEFFKDDPSRRCSKCGLRMVNPKVLQGCAQWCEYARECLGFDPKALSSDQQQQLTVADQLIDAVKAEFGGDQRRITHALLVLEQAERILAAEGGKARVVVAAALLHDIGIQQAQRRHGSSAGRYQEIEGPPIARRIMQEIGFGQETIEHVLRIVGSHHSGDIDTLEFRIIWDADNLINLAEKLTTGDEDKPKAIIEGVFRTETGKTRAHEVFAQHKLK